MEAESDEKTEPETQRDGWRLRKRGRREPPEFRDQSNPHGKAKSKPLGLPQHHGKCCVPRVTRPPVPLGLSLLCC